MVYTTLENTLDRYEMEAMCTCSGSKILMNGQKNIQQRIHERALRKMPSPSSAAIALPKSMLLIQKIHKKTSLAFSVPLLGTRKKTKSVNTSFRDQNLWVYSNEKIHMKLQKTPFQRKGLMVEASVVVLYRKMGLTACTWSNVRCRQVWSQVFYRAT